MKLQTQVPQSLVPTLLDSTARSLPKLACGTEADTVTVQSHEKELSTRGAVADDGKVQCICGSDHDELDMVTQYLSLLRYFPEP